MIPEESDLNVSLGKKESDYISQEPPKLEKKENKKSDSWKSWLVVVIFILGAGFLFLVSQGYFLSDNNQNVELTPNHTTNTKNNYDFEPNTNNKYNFTINNEIILKKDVLKNAIEEVIEENNITTQ